MSDAVLAWLSVWRAVQMICSQKVCESLKFGLRKFNSTQRASMDAGVKHLSVHIYPVTSVSSTTINLIRVLIYRRFKFVISF